MEINENSPWVDDEWRQIADKVNKNTGEKQHSMTGYIKAQENKRYLHIYGNIKDLMKNQPALQTRDMFLWYMVQNGPWKGKEDNHNTWSYWHEQKDLIAFSLGQTKICKDIGCHRSKIVRWVKELKKAGLIRVEKERRENVYILGRVIDGIDIYFYQM